jgi:lipoprotein-releasing system ATP-binding protein
MNSMAGERPCILSLRGVSKGFRHSGTDIRVLCGIDLDVLEGETIAVMGASGVGKSTLLNIMGSLEPPSEGSVSFMGRDLYSMDDASLCRLRNRDIGFIFQFHHLLPEMNALENVMMPGMIARLPADECRRRARRVLEQVGLAERMRHRTGELSGGEQQRVAIARALIMGPRLVLADEPTGSLDWATGREVADLLFRCSRESGVAMVVATHNQQLAAMMARSMEIVGGKISARD